MKKITLIILFIVAVCNVKSAKAQITLEHAYDSAYLNLYMVNLDIEGMKYVNRNYNGGVIELYNLNHSIFRIMPLPPAPSNAGNQYTLYISEHLFSCDDDSISFMYGYYISMNPNHGWYFYILSESGNIMFYADSLSPIVNPNAPQEQLPIYNTPNGTKMILSTTKGSGKANVYDLCGTLVAAIQPAGTIANVAALSIFPNPSHENATIDFNLPKGINTADVVLYNLNGTEIKRYKVDRTFSNLILNNSDLSAGTYLYQLVTTSGGLGAKKMVVIK